MKSEGIVRKLDGLGRVVLPIHLRRNLGVTLKELLSIWASSMPRITGV